MFNPDLLKNPEEGERQESLRNSIQVELMKIIGTKLGRKFMMSDWIEEGYAERFGKIWDSGEGGMYKTEYGTNPKETLAKLEERVELKH